MGIVVTGLERSGSTFIWNVLRELTPARVAKSHGNEGLGNGQYIVATIRDPRDVVCSYADAKQVTYRYAYECLFKRLHRDKLMLQISATKGRIFVARYEDWFPNKTVQLVKELSAFIGHRFLNDKKAEELAEKWSIENCKKISSCMVNFVDFDKSNHIHGRHITNDGKVGGWKEKLGKSLADEMTRDLKSVLAAYEYEGGKQ